MAAKNNFKIKRFFFIERNIGSFNPKCESLNTNAKMFNPIAYSKYQLIFTAKIETVNALFKNTALKPRNRFFNNN